MGIFDFLKPKTASDQIIALVKSITPGGQAQFEKATRIIRKLSSGKLDDTQAMQLYCMTKTNMVIFERNIEIIYTKMSERFTNLSQNEKDTIIVFIYLDLINPKLEENSDFGQMKDQFESTLFYYRDAIDASSIKVEGPFGGKSNPILIAGIPEEEKYLSKLRTLEGKRISWNRNGSVSSNNFPHPIDLYTVFNTDKKEIAKIYLYPYSSQTSTLAPEGFNIIV